MFFPGILFPALLFLLLYAWPFLEKLISLDLEPYHVLHLPWQQPFYTAFGSAILAFLLVLFLASGDDVLAIVTGGSVTQLRTLFRFLGFVAPAVVGVSVYGICVRLQQRKSRSEKARSW